MADVVQIVDGFSLTNRWLLYTSFMLAPAQFLGGVANNCPSNIGFLAYNWYTQVQWYFACQNRELHALSLLPVHFNFIYAFSYLGGITSGNIFMGVFLGLGTAGVMILNNVSAWIAWQSNQPEGFGVYEFFFFGWRKLSPGWHKFIMVWMIGDSFTALLCIVIAISVSIYVARLDEDEDLPEVFGEVGWMSPAAQVQALRYPAIVVGAALMLVFGWPVIMWTELIVARNHIRSDTDWVAVWLFVAQVVTMVVPSCGTTLGCFRGAARATL
ncbi:hypothetical protein LMH87_003862 [Akanthomyces muscarius]|uniref:Uncharacterized protein n=1 Tax=Akanthomyces muscarius TaxID=2231603 RepID=A0A9W8Q5C2_AKAMU|nr:hypothetical protein LMH87_003862 [Akanthomyces muscarius]KAJ4144997.1 hypothetical protein LMH87_003862 [Akanthomyces muscarius]